MFVKERSAAEQTAAIFTLNQTCDVTCVSRFLLTVFQLTDLTVFLLQLLADLLHRDVVAERLGHLVDHLGGCVARCSDVVTLNV